MNIPIVGSSYQMEARSFDQQRSINLYPIVSETQTSKSIVAMRSTSGLKEFATIGGGGIRGGIESDGRAFFVSGNELYEVYKDGTSTNRGTMLTGTSRVQIEENPTQIMIVDGEYGYILNKTTNVFSQITDGDFPVPSSLTFQDGYFLVSDKDTGKFYISSLNNGLAWNALDFTTVEGSPDKLVAIKSVRGNIFSFGTKITEPYQNTGNATFPFQKIIGATIETGCAAADTIEVLDNSVFWLGSDENGDKIVWRNNGYNAQRVSTQAIEKRISESTNIEESFSWVYHERGHAFYMLFIKGLDTTLCLDVATGEWHERASRNTSTGANEQHRGACHVFFDQKHLIGDRDTNQIYHASLDFYDDDGNTRIIERITPHYDEMKRLIAHAQLELDMEVATGLTSGQGSDPQIMMQYSDDGGNTWSSELWIPLGKKGKYHTRVKWNKLGRSRDRIYRIRISDPVFVQINEAILNGS